MFLKYLYRKTDSLFRESDQQSVLVKLLQDSPVKPSQPMSEMSQSKVSCQAHKRSNNMGLADLSNPKRMKVPVMKIPSGGPFAARVAPVQPSRGATSSLFELLTEMPRGFSPVSLTKKQQSSSVLQNLLVSGHDLQTGHELQKRHSSCKAVSSSSSCFVSLLPSSLPSWEKVLLSFFSLFRLSLLSVRLVENSKYARFIFNLFSFSFDFFSLSSCSSQFSAFSTYTIML